MIVKPACPKCGLFYRPKKNGQSFEEGKPFNDETPVRYRTLDGTEWTSYKLWRGDLWECRGCGAEVIIGVIAGPVREHYQPEYKEYREAMGGDDLPFIHDC